MLSLKHPYGTKIHDTEKKNSKTKKFHPVFMLPLTAMAEAAAHTCITF